MYRFIAIIGFIDIGVYRGFSLVTKNTTGAILVMALQSGPRWAGAGLERVGLRPGEIAPAAQRVDALKAQYTFKSEMDAQARKAFFPRMA
jgi:hypothetical protein